METTPRRVGDGHPIPHNRESAVGSGTREGDETGDGGPTARQKGATPLAGLEQLPVGERPSPAIAFSSVTGPTGPGSLVQLAVGAHLLTLGTPDGSEVVPLPVASRPIPERIRPAADAEDSPPLGRAAEITEIRGMLRRGTSVRVGGPAGIGRSTLLRHLAAGDSVGAPDGVVVLDGRRRGLDDLLQQFHDACFTGEPHRPGRDTLAGLLVDVAALVVVDDLDISPTEIDELLRIAPECVFLVASRPSPRNPDGSVADAIVRADSPFHEITLGGLPQDAAFALLARAAGRELDDEELAWAAALWFEVDGHPGRFVQAGALLARLGSGRFRDAGDRLRDGTRAGAAGRRDAESAYDLFEAQFGSPVPELPSPGEPRLFVPRLVPLLSSSAQQVLRLGAALEGVLPDPAHLPALTGATDAHSAATELVSAGLAVVEGGRYRLAAGVTDEAAGLMRGPSSWTVAAMQHFTWWVSHPTVSAAQVAEEADVILACLREVERLGKPSSVRVLARAAAPAFASALRFEAWRSCLELGRAACASSGASTEQAWFRHELAVLSLCEGDNEQAREEATAASRLRDAGDKRGLAADRRVLLLAGERPRTAVGGVAADVATAGRRRALSASMAGRRGVMTWGAAAVLVVTLGVVVALGSGDTSGDGEAPGTGDATVSRTAPVGGGGSPAGVVVPAVGTNGRTGEASSSGSAAATTPGDARSASASKSPAATGSSAVATGTPVSPAPPPPAPGGVPEPPPPPPPAPDPGGSTPGSPDPSTEPTPTTLPPSSPSASATTPPGTGDPSTSAAVPPT